MGNPTDRLVLGTPILVEIPVAAASANIVVGDMIGVSSGYAVQAAAGENVLLGFAHENVTSPSADGDVTVKVDISKETVYRYPIDTGSVAVTDLTGSTCDCGGPQAVNEDATTDNVLRIVKVLVDTDEFYVTRA